MSDELKPCPNRECRNDRVGTASRVLDASGLSQAFGECPTCGTRGPLAVGPTLADAEAEARRLWNALPRDEPADDAREGEATRLLRRLAATNPWICDECWACFEDQDDSHADDCLWAAAKRHVEAAGRADA